MLVICLLVSLLLPTALLILMILAEIAEHDRANVIAIAILAVLCAAITVSICQVA